ncbi:hypothetical protein Pint_20111 [Pistacia integerrima]|uniref:Uncharacterized protein n=1 Tax=Pistacia integerrima TaxID=434235 RepID=A0ACC0XEB1_9ROSI|nr:hypothetical protein Pint_20111 [Pistacia integerrima]
MVISIGPYHPGNPELELIQQHKHTMACQYEYGNSKLLEELYRNVKRLAKDARECYTHQSSVAKFNEEEFTHMMVLDACFILQFIYL